MTRALHLLKIDLKKMRNYRTFWVICGLYFGILAATTLSGMEFLKWLASFIEGFGEKININRIPLYHFPDVWLNMIWCAGWLKYILAIMAVISITNEYQYRTIRQNVIDGLSRWEFVKSKILMNLVLSLASVVLIFFNGLVTGFIYTPTIEWSYVFVDTEFLFAYFLEVFFFLSFATMIGVLIQRAGLSIVLILFGQLIELIITHKFLDGADFVKYFPMKSIWHLTEVPFMRYALQEIEDSLSLLKVAVVIFWIFVFNAISYWKLKKADI